MPAAKLDDLLTEKWNQGMTWEAFLTYSQKNVDQMRENYEKTEVPPDLIDQIKGLRDDARLLVIGADWCGDVVANVPSIAKMATLNKKIQLRVLDRDRHDDLMGHFLTNGAKAIPKIIVAPGAMNRHSTWGPRPADCQKIMSENKEKMPKEQIYPMLREWYQKDRNQTVQREIWREIQSQVSGD